jgi:predicted hydrocarbon binding protein
MIEPLPRLPEIWTVFHLLSHIGVMIALLSALTFFWVIIKRIEDVLRLGRFRSNMILASLFLYVAHCPILRLFTVDARILSDIILLMASLTFLIAAAALNRVPGLKDAIFDIGFFRELSASMERFVGPAGATFQRETGMQHAKRYLKEKPANFEEALESIEKMGFGEAEVIEEKEGKMQVRLYESSLAKGIKSEKPICHLVSGFIRGLAEEFYGRWCTCTENKCMAEGNPYCEFEVVLKE